MTTSPEARARAEALLKLIRRAETDKTGPESYNVIIGNRQDRLAKALTSMTLDEVLTDQKRWIRNKWGSAAGAYQILRPTLLGLKEKLKLTGTERFDAALQDRLAMELLSEIGFELFLSGTQSVSSFGLGLSRTWASFPVLLATNGAHGPIEPGESYYKGVGDNAARIKPAEVVEVLAGLRGTAATTSSATEPPPSQSILSVQRRLKELGYAEVGKIDGLMGPMTETAILAFRKDNNLPLSTRIDDPLIVALAKAQPRELAATRVEATPKEVREQVPEARNSFRNRIISAIAGAFAAAGGFVSGVLENIPGAKDLAQPLMDLGGHIPVWVWFVVVCLIAGFIYVQAHKGSQRIVAAFQDGSRR